MKTLMRILVLMVPLLFLFNGCGGGGSNSSAQTSNPNLKEVTVGINLPNTTSSKPTGAFEKSSTGSTIDSVTIDVLGKGNYGFTKKMEQSAVTGQWSVNLLLDTTKAPFKFTVKAYEGVTKLYEGIIQNVTTET